MVAKSKTSKVEELLPWYVNDTLIREERETVEQGLENDAALHDEEEFLRMLRNSIKAGAAISPGEFGLKRLQKQISEEQKKPAPSQQTWWRPLAIAATVALLIQGGVLVNLWNNQQGTTYGPLSDGGLTTSVAAGPVLQMSFAPSATEVQIRAILQKYSAEIVAGPGSLGVYRVQLSADMGSDEKLKTVIADLKGQTAIISHVEQE